MALPAADVGRDDGHHVLFSAARPPLTSRSVGVLVLCLLAPCTNILLAALAAPSLAGLAAGWLLLIRRRCSALPATVFDFTGR